MGVPSDQVESGREELAQAFEAALSEDHVVDDDLSLSTSGYAHKGLTMSNCHQRALETAVRLYLVQDARESTKP
jgi:hypothetical protein